MRGRRVTGGSIAAAAAVLLFLVASSGDTIVEAQSQNKGANLVGTWFVSTPAGLTAFITYHQGGTLVEMRSHEFGGPPRPGDGRSSLRGVWRRVGGQFESVAYSFTFDGTNGDALRIVRVRHEFSLDPGFETAAGDIFVAQWFCPTALTCPDPSATDPDIPEFPAGYFTQKRLP